MATVTTKKRNMAMEFIKKTAGYLTGATGDYFTEIMPDTSSTISGAGAALSELNSKFRSTTAPILNGVRSLNRQLGFRSLTRWYLEQENDFDDIVEEDTLSLDGIEDTEDVGAVAQITELQHTANQISKSVVETSHKAMEAQLQSTVNLMAGIDKETAVISAGFDKTNDTLNKILEVVTKNTSAMIEATVASSRPRGDQSPNDKMMSGGFNFDDFKKMVGKNIQSTEAGMMASMIMPFMSGGMMKNMFGPQDIIKMGLSFGINKMAPNLKQNAGALDKAVGDVVMQSLIRLGEERNSSNGFMSGIAKIFGIDSRRQEINTQRSNLELKAVPFDTVAKEALTDAIPGYLRKILVQLGGHDLLYDYRSRSFRSQGAIAKEFHQNVASTGNLFNMSNTTKKAIGTNDTSRMLLDMLITKLGTEDSAQIMNKLSYQKEASKYITEIVEAAGVTVSKQDIDTFSSNFQKLYPAGKDIEIYNQAKKENVNRAKKGNAFIDNAQDFSLDTSQIRDNYVEDLKAIAEIYGKQPTDTSSISEKKDLGVLSGTDYTNMALYEIYRRLNVGVNVYQVGSDRSQKKRFAKLKDDYLKVPTGHKPRSIQEDEIIVNPIENTNNKPIEDTGPNELLNNEGEDLTTGERVGRWGKNRGGNLIKAIAKGDPDQVKAAFGAIVGDLGEVGAGAMKTAASKINNAFGNVGGYLKHKVFGTGYSYVDENGRTVNVEENKAGGVFGFVKENIVGMFSKGKNAATNWFKTVAGYFDYSDGDPAEKSVASKRMKFLTTSVGAYAGLGILGGPMGLLAGAVAGNALGSISGIGTKIKSFLFGDKEKAGLFSRMANTVLDPIRFQVGKWTHTLGNVLKKNIFGPLSDIGWAIKERIKDGITTAFSPLFKAIGSAIKGVGGLIGKGIKGLFGVGVAGKGIMERGILEGGGMLAGAPLRAGARVITGFNMERQRKLSERQRLRNEEIAKGDEESGYYDGKQKLFSPSTWGGTNYKDWKEKREEERAEKRRTGNTLGSRWSELEQQEKDAADKAVLEVNEKQVELAESSLTEAKESNETLKLIASVIAPGGTEAPSTAEISETSSATLALPAHATSHISSIKEPEEVVNTPVTEGSTIASTVSTDNNITPVNPSSIKEAKKAEEINESQSLAASLGSAMVSGSTQDGVSDAEAEIAMDVAKDSIGSPTKQGVLSKVKNFFNVNKESKEEVKEEKENWLMNLLGGFGSLITGGIKSLLTSKLGLAGIAAFLLSTEFGQKIAGWMGEGAMKLGGFLVEKLPSIISGAIGMFMTPVKAVANAADDYANDTHSEAIDERLGGGTDTIQDADVHAKRGVGDIVKSGALTAGLMKVGSKAIQWVGQKAVNIAATGASVGLKTASAGASVVQAGSKAVGATASLGEKIATGVKSFKEARTAGFTLKESLQYGNAMTKDAATNAVTKTAGNVSGAAGNLQTAAKSGLGKVQTFAKNFGANFAKAANVVIAGATAASMGIDAQETYSNARIQGDYGFGDAGGFVKMPKTVRYSAMGAAGLATLLVLGTNPAGWAVVAASLIAALASAIFSWVYNVITTGSNEDAAVVTNSTKVHGLLTGKVSTTGEEDARYVYNAKESDRPLGLVKGKNYLDPEVTLGGYVTGVINNATTYPGAEVLLYDLCNNMSYQGVPAAIYATHQSSKVIGFKGWVFDSDNYNKTQVGDPPENAGNGKTQVKYSDFEDDKQNIIVHELEQNVRRRDPSKSFSVEDLEELYNAAKEVVDYLKGTGLVKADGSVNERLFNKLTDKGWETLEKTIKDKNLYFFMKCIIYINSKVEVTFWKGLQWVEVHKDNIESVIKASGVIGAATLSEAMDEARKEGVDDETLQKVRSGPDSNIATEAGEVVAASPVGEYLNKQNISGPAKDEIRKEIHNLDTAYMLSNPKSLEAWILKNNPEDPDATKGYISDWKKYTSTVDADRKATLFEKMYNYSRMYAEGGPDTFGVLKHFNWDKLPAKIQQKAMEQAMAGGSMEGMTVQDLTPAVVLRSHFGPSEKSNLGQLISKMDEGTSETPDSAREWLYGQSGTNPSIPDEPGWSFTGTSNYRNYGTLGGIAENIKSYADSEDELSKANWGTILKSIRGEIDGVGGPEEGSAETSSTKPAAVSTPSVPGTSTVTPSTTDGSSESQEFTVAEGGNPISKDYAITSHFGDNESFRKSPHGGIDLVPNPREPKERRSADIVSRFHGKISKISNSIPGNSGGTGGGNSVYIETPDGKTIMNMHLKGNSIPGNIKPGVEVKPGDKIGEMGSTGHSTGPHLHYQIQDKSGKKLDPETTLKGGAPLASIYNPGSKPATNVFAGNDNGSGSAYENAKSQTISILNSTDGIFGKISKVMGLVWDVLKKSGIGQFFAGMFGSATSSFGGSIDTSASTNKGGGWSSEKDQPKINSEVITMKTNMVSDMVGSTAKQYKLVDLREGKTFRISLKVSKDFNGQFTPVSREDVEIITKGLLNVNGDLNDPELWKEIGWSGRPGILTLKEDEQDPKKDVNVAVCFNTYPHGDMIGNVNPGSPFVKADDNKVDSEPTDGKSGPEEFPLGGHMSMYFGDSKSPENDNPDPGQFDSLYNSIVAKAVELGKKAYTLSQENQKTSSANPSDPSAAASTSGGNFQDTGNNTQTAWNYLKSKGFSDEGIAGILGNFAAESGMNPERVQGDYSKGHQESAMYTSRIDSGDMTEDQFVKDKKGGGGYGLAQWTYPARKKNLYQYLKSKGKSIGDLQGQLDFAMQEMSSKLKNDLVGSKDVSNAAVRMVTEYEKPAGYQTPEKQQERISSSQGIFAKYNNSGGEVSSIGPTSMASVPANTPPTEGAGGPDGVGGPEGFNKFNKRFNQFAKIGDTLLNTYNKKQADPNNSKWTLSDVGDIGKSLLSDSNYSMKTPGFNNHRLPGIDSLINKGASALKSELNTRLPDINNLGGVVDKGVDILSNNANKLTNGSNDGRVEQLLSDVITELRNITGNTGTSSELLGTLNEKDFGVDKEVRDGIHKLSKTKPKRTVPQVKDSGNINTINSMIHP